VDYKKNVILFSKVLTQYSRNNMLGITSELFYDQINMVSSILLCCLLIIAKTKFERYQRG